MLLETGQKFNKDTEEWEFKDDDNTDRLVKCSISDLPEQSNLYFKA